MAQRIVLLLLGVFVACTVGAATAKEKQPSVQLFALVRPDDPRLSKLLGRSDVDGIAVQIGWSEIEVTDSRYRWQTLDDVLAAAKRAHKRVVLEVLATPRPPSWLEGAGATMVDATLPSSGLTFRTPVAWDPVYLAKFSEFLPDLASHMVDIAASSTVVAVAVGAPVPEMSLVPCRNGEVAAGIPYDRIAYLAAWKAMIDLYAKAFPILRKPISAPVRVICMPEEDAQFYREVMGYALSRYGRSFWLFATDLNAKGSERMAPYADLRKRASLAYQTIWSASGDPTNRMQGAFPGNLKQAVCKALAQGARHIELYPADILSSNKSIRAAVTAVHQPRTC